MDTNYTSRISWNFWAIVLLHFSLYICIGVYPVNIENLMADLPGTTASGISFITITALVISTIAMLLFGYYGEALTAKISRRNLFFIVNICWILGIGLRVVAFDYNIFLFSTVFFAIGSGAAFLPLGYPIIADSYPPERRANRFGIMYIALLVGSAFGSIIAALLTNFWGVTAWRISYLIGMIVSSIAIIFYFIVGIEPERGRSEPELQDFKGKLDSTYKLTFRNFLQVLQNNSIKGILLYEICLGVQYSALSIWTIYYLTTKITVPNAIMIATIIPLIGSIGAIIGTALGGRFGDSFYRAGKIRGRISISVFGLIVGIIVFFIFYSIPFFSSSIEELVLFIFIFTSLSFVGYLFSSFAIGNIYSIFSEVTTPELRGIANSLLGIMINLGGVIGQFLIVLMVQIDLGLLSSGIIIVLAIWLFGVIFWILPYIYYPKEAKELRNLMSMRRKDLDQQLSGNS